MLLPNKFIVVESSLDRTGSKRREKELNKAWQKR